MPISLPALSRRKFLGGSLAAGLGMMLSRNGISAEADPHRFFLLSDTHIPGEAAFMNAGVNMFNNLKGSIADLIASNGRAAAILINGDLAFKTGETNDYTQLMGLLKPAREAGMPIHMALGNHDNRAHFWTAIQNEKDAGKGPGTAVEDRYVTVIETPRANWFLLDSLDKVNSTPGVLGQKQADWLGKALDQREDKPAIVMVHHNPMFKNPNAAEKPKVEGEKKEPPKVSGLSDTELLWPVLQSRKQVKALFFGHTHNWSVTKRDEIHLINLPTVAYAFGKDKPTGWVDCKLETAGMGLTLNTIDKKHANNGQKVELVWR